MTPHKNPIHHQNPLISCISEAFAIFLSRASYIPSEAMKNALAATKAVIAIFGACQTDNASANSEKKHKEASTESHARWLRFASP